MIMEKILNEGLPHIGESIFKHLSGPELCICRLVCKSWNEFVIQRHKLWISISEDIIHSVKHTSSQQWQIIKKASVDKNQARKVSLMLMWWTKKCSEGFSSQASPYVISFNYPKSLIYLLSLSSEKNPIDDFGAGILHLAAVYNNLEAIKIISNHLENKNPPATKLSSYTPLHFATVQNHVECMEYILEQCNEKNPEGLYGKTPIHIAAEFGHLEALQCLTKYAAEKNPKMERTGGFWTPLHFACEYGHSKVVKHLLEFIDDPNPLTADGHAPIHLAIFSGHLQCVKTIIEHYEDFDLHIENGHGKTPFQCALELDRTEIISYLNWCFLNL